MVNQYGSMVYIILFFIVFAETGFVVTPFLPGDSLLFAAGALAAASKLDFWLLVVLFTVAATVGNTVNYFVGRYVGPKVYNMNSRWIKKEYLERTHVFYEKYGATAVVLSRFVPIFRTFVPFVAGIAQMNWARFILYTAFSALIWVIPITLLGYLFGELPIIKNNFSLAVIGIIVVSLIPVFYQAVKGYFRKKD
jgi:membrane-associated protein